MIPNAIIVMHSIWNTEEDAKYCIRVFASEKWRETLTPVGVVLVEFCEQLNININSNNRVAKIIKIKDQHVFISAGAIMLTENEFIELRIACADVVNEIHFGNIDKVIA